MCCSPTGHSSNACIQPSSCQTGSSHDMVKLLLPMEGKYSPTFAVDSISQTAVLTVHPPADTVTSVQSANSEGTHSRIVKSERERLSRSLQPNNVWSSGSYSLNTADWTTMHWLYFSIPFHELDNPITSNTISSNPSLFRIVTPINVDHFESLLASHPNRQKVDSICKGLREGFWPWADTSIEGYPTTHDASNSVKEVLTKPLSYEHKFRSNRTGSASLLHLVTLSSWACIACPSMLFRNRILLSFAWLPIIVLACSR